MLHAYLGPELQTGARDGAGGNSSGDDTDATRATSGDGGNRPAAGERG